MDLDDTQNMMFKVVSDGAMEFLFAQIVQYQPGHIGATLSKPYPEGSVPHSKFLRTVICPSGCTPRRAFEEIISSIQGTYVREDRQHVIQALEIERSKMFLSPDVIQTITGAAFQAVLVDRVDI